MRVLLHLKCSTVYIEPKYQAMQEKPSVRTIFQKKVNKIPKQVSKIYSFPEKLFKFYEIKFSGP